MYTIISQIVVRLLLINTNTLAWKFLSKPLLGFNFGVFSCTLWSWFDKKIQTSATVKKKALVNFENLDSECLGCDPVDKFVFMDQPWAMQLGKILLFPFGVSCHV